MRVHITAYATTIPAATPSRALVSPGSVVGGALRDTSQPHWAHSFASADIGSPQKLQCFFTLVSSGAAAQLPLVNGERVYPLLGARGSRFRWIKGLSSWLETRCLLLNFLYGR